uniref:40S ribosomal protein S21 n=1 Tax=Chelydra serpentina TaxID=8475 RepID=A0A8C3T7N0_CHESE
MKGWSLFRQSTIWLCTHNRVRASPNLKISLVDKVTGRVNGQFKTYAICGAIRRMGESDDSILRLAKNDGIVSKNF